MNVRDYLSSYLKLDAAAVTTCWDSLREEITGESEHPLQDIMPAPHSSRESIDTLNSLDLRT